MKKLIFALVLISSTALTIVQGNIEIVDHAVKIAQIPTDIKLQLLKTSLYRKDKNLFNNLWASLPNQDLHKAYEDFGNYLSTLDKFDPDCFNLKFLEHLRDMGIRLHGWTFFSRALQKMADMIFLDEIHSESDWEVYENLRKSCDILVEMGADVQNKEILLYNWTQPAIAYLQSKGMDVSSHLDWYLGYTKSYYRTWYENGRDPFIREFLSIVKNLDKIKYSQLIKSQEALPLLLVKDSPEEFREFLKANNITQKTKDEILNQAIANNDQIMIIALLNFGEKI